MLPPEIEAYRDHTWQRELTQRVETAPQAEAFINRVGFSNSLTDARKPGPSLYVAVCGRRDVTAPRNVQKDPETSLTWVLKDEIIGRGKMYYGKLARGRAMFLSPEMLPFFAAVWGVKKSAEKKQLSPAAQSILKILRKEYESASIDLRKDAGIADRKIFNQAMDELQAAMIVIPSEVVYEPKFTYIWTLAEVRFAKELNTKIDRPTAVREIARMFLTNAGMTIPGELARVTGIARPAAGLGNRALVAEGFAHSPKQGTYVLTDLPTRLAKLNL